METLDVILGMILIISFLFGLSKGFIKSVLSLFGIVTAVYFGIKFSGRPESYLSERFNLSTDLAQIFAFLMIFVLVMIVFSIAGKILTKAAGIMMMGSINKLIGGIFSMLKYAFVVSVVFMFVNASEFYSILTKENRDNSILYKPIVSLAPAILPELKRNVHNMDLDWNSSESEENQPEETDVDSGL